MWQSQVLRGTSLTVLPDTAPIIGPGKKRSDPVIPVHPTPFSFSFFFSSSFFFFIHRLNKKKNI